MRILTWNKKSAGRAAGILLTVMLLTCLLLSGCDANGSEDVKEIIGKLYYVNDEYVATGNEELDDLMPAYEKSLEVGSEDQYLAVLEELKTVPADGYSTMMNSKLTINSVEVEDNNAVVDFSSDNLSGSSLEETLLIHQIVRTLTDSFGVETVAFTVDGKTVESLMGHVESSLVYAVSADENGKTVVAPVSE